MKKIYIKTEGIDWKHIKPAVDLIRSTGQTVIKRKDDDNIQAECAIGLCNKTNWIDADWEYSACDPEDDFEVLEIPQDMDRLKELLGIREVPKDGGVYCDGSYIIRYKSDGYGYYSEVYSIFVDNTFFDYTKNFNMDQSFKEATKEEEQKLIDAEHANGIHWDGKELVEYKPNLKVETELDAYMEDFWKCHSRILDVRNANLIEENERLKQKLNEIKSKCDY